VIGYTDLAGQLDIPDSHNGHRRALAVLAHLRATQIQ
jgi:hypothetical protein